MAPVSYTLSFPSQLRQFREADAATDLAEDEPGEDAESDVAESVEDAAVILLRLGLHDVDGLSGNVVGVVFGHRVPPCRF